MPPREWPLCQGPPGEPVCGVGSGPGPRGRLKEPELVRVAKGRWGKRSLLVSFPGVRSSATGDENSQSLGPDGQRVSGTVLGPVLRGRARKHLERGTAGAGAHSGNAPPWTPRSP